MDAPRWQNDSDISLAGIVERGQMYPRGYGFYWLAQTIRAIQTTSDIDKVRSRCSALSDLSSMLLVVLRLSSLTMTSSFLVLTTTRSPLRTGAAGEMTMTSPSR